MVKKPYFSLFSASPRGKAWRISSPHISTSENLHVKQKPVFSVLLRLLRVFCCSAKLCHFFTMRFWGRFFSQRVIFKQSACRWEKLSHFLAVGIPKVSWKENLTVNLLCLVDASVYSIAIWYAHQVLVANFFVWKKPCSCRFWVQCLLCGA